jgi:hypothetical protein
MHTTTRRGNPGRWLKAGVRGRLRGVLRMRRGPVSFAARLRMYWHDIGHVLFEGTETCQDCGRRFALWRAPDDLWREVYGSAGGILCPLCFGRQAREAGIIVMFEARVLRRVSERAA